MPSLDLRCIAAAGGLVVSLASSDSFAQPCAGQGNAALALTSTEAPAPGRRLAFELSGAPGRPFAIAADVGPGPVVRPGVGTICLDLGPRLRVLFDGLGSGAPALDANGRFAFTLALPPRADVASRTIHLQAFVRDPVAPNGFALSPPLAVEIARAFVETFSTTEARDAARTTAVWDGGGVVSGRTGSPRTVGVTPADAGFNLADPLRPEGSRFQMLFDAADLGAGRGESILGMSWGPRSNFVFAARYEGTQILLGHARFSPGGLSLTYDANYDEPPERLFTGAYATSNRTDAEWFPWPAFSSDFEYDGERDLVFEVSVPPGAPTYQLFRASWSSRVPVRRLVAAPGSPNGNAGGDTVYHTRFTLARLRTIAQSDWFNTRLADPDYLEPVVRVASLPPGTEVVAEYEGAEDDDFDRVPDAGTSTGFRADIDVIDGSKLVRFRLRLKGNLSTGAVPRVTAMTIPFR